VHGDHGGGSGGAPRRRGDQGERDEDTLEDNGRARDAWGQGRVARGQLVRGDVITGRRGEGVG
jgi:hypothetical protein